MALKLFISNSEIKKLGEILYKGPKYVPARFLGRQVPKHCSRSFHRYSQGVRQLNVLYMKQNRFIHFASILHGKVVPFKLSDIGEGIVEVTIKEWFVKPGDKIAQFDSICEVQSDKASVTISSRFDGVVKKLHHEIDQMAKVGAPLIDIEVEESQDSDSDSDDEKESVPSSSSDKSSIKSDDSGQVRDVRARALATPAVRRIAKENNIDIQQIEGRGKGGRVLKEDILAYIEGKTGAVGKIPSAPQDIPPIIHSQEDRTVVITGIKKAMVKSMAAAWTAPHFSYCDEIDVGELVKMKPTLSRLSSAHKCKITFMPFFIKAASLALLKYPELNALVNNECESLTIKASHNIGVAIDTKFGLVVPNIKNVQQLSVIEVAKELNRLQESGAKGQLGLDDLNNGTFTLSNVGAIGGTYTKPLLLVPQVVIGGLGKIQVLPRFDANKNLIEAHIFNISWSADHRAVDGATMARFSNLWKMYLASPELILQL